MPNIAIIVDLETTGLNSNTDQIIEIGAIKFDIDTGEVLDSFQTFSTPDEVYEFDYDNDDGSDLEPIPFELDPFIADLTGITEEMLEGAPSNSEAVYSFFEFAENYPIWAYNAGFDSRFLNQHTEEKKSLKDIIPVAKRAFIGLENYKLSTVGAHLNVSTEGAHRAIADCLISKEVLVRGLKVQSETPSSHYYHHTGFKASDYAATEDGVFYGKTIVFTGSLVSMTRDNAAVTASKYGFSIGSSVTKKTDYLVVGIQDLHHLAGHEKSSKHRKAEELASEGLQIQILTEDDFLKIIG